MTPTDAPPRPTRSLRRRRACTAWGLTTLTIVTTLGGGTGCTTWNPGPVPPRGAPTVRVTYDHPVRLRFTNGNTVVLTHARVVGDSIVGHPEDAPDESYAFSAALDKVRGLEERHVSGGRTAALVLVPLIALGVMVAVAASNIKVAPQNIITDVVRPGVHVRGLGTGH